MAEPGRESPPPRESRDLVAQLLLAGIGAASLTAERIEELVDAVAERGSAQRDETRAAIENVVSRWRGDVTRVTERAGAGMHGILREFGLVLRSEHEDLELRVAQVEHRLRLVENAAEPPVVPPTAP
jgi:polyhydroxyalkanoate synthesis regulator phasin